MLSIYKFSKFEIFAYLIFLNFAISIEYFIYGKGVNLLLISIMILLIFLNLNLLFKFYKKQIILYSLPIFLIFPFFTNSSTFVLQSYFYGLFFLSVFHLFIHILYSGSFNYVLYLKILKLIINLYFYTSLIQFILLKFGIEFNRIWLKGSDELRINSLATEPSYTGIIVVITFYSYLIFRKKTIKVNYGYSEILSDLKYWFFVLFIIFASQSGYALVFLILLLTATFNIKRNSYFMLITISLGILIGLYNLNLSTFERVNNFFFAAITFDVNNMVVGDHSASIRVAPVVIYISHLNPLDFSFWFGYGQEYSKNLMVSIIPGIVFDKWKGGAFFPSHFINYGFISTMFFLIFFYKNTISKFLSFDILFLFLILINSSFNSQLFWFSIMLFTANKYFIQKLYLKL